MNNAASKKPLSIRSSDAGVAGGSDGETDQVLGALPNWDLSDLYPGRESAELRGDFDWSAREAKDFQKRYQGKLAELSGKDLADAIARYEEIDERLSRILSYAQLVYSEDMSDPKVARFYQSAQEEATEISASLLFFTLELNGIEDGDIEKKLNDESLARYRPWIADQRIMRPYQIPEDQERLLHEKHVSGRGAWTRLFDETMAGLRFPFKDRELTSAEILNLFSDPDGEKRKAAAKSLGAVLGQNTRLFALLTNTLAKDKATEDSWRGLERPVSPRNLANLVEDDVVDALVDAVRGSYGDLAHRYYRLKAKWFGLEALPYWDRNAPLPNAAVN